MARPRKHIIKFTDEEVKALKSRLRSKKTNSTLRGCIQVLFLRDTNHSDGKYSYEMIGEKSGTSLSTVRTVKIANVGTWHAMSLQNFKIPILKHPHKDSVNSPKVGLFLF